MSRNEVVLEPDNYPSVEQEPLAQVELEALAYWERFLPTTSASLKKQGPLALETEIRKAWHRREYLMALEQARNPTMNPLVAEELFRDVLYPQPEQPETPATEPLITS